MHRERLRSIGRPHCGLPPSAQLASLKQALRLTPPALYFSLRAPASSNGRGAEWDFKVNTQARPSQALGQARAANMRSLAQPAYCSSGGSSHWCFLLPYPGRALCSVIISAVCLCACVNSKIHKKCQNQRLAPSRGELSAKLTERGCACILSVFKPVIHGEAEIKKPFLFPPLTSDPRP